MIINPSVLINPHAVDYMGYIRANAIPIIFSPGRPETEIEVPITNDRLVEGTFNFCFQWHWLECIPCSRLHGICQD